MDKIYLKSYPRCGGESVKTEEGRAWKSMNTRCKPKHEQRTYHGCTISDNFKNFQFFAEWCNNQIGFRDVDENGLKYHLDKDILVKGNKVYSEDMCVFVPVALNSLLVKSNATRGLLPIGVSKGRPDSMFRANCRNPFTGKREEFGMYNSVEDAFSVYKSYKESAVREYSETFRGKVDERVIDALSKYIVEITD